MCEAPDNRKPPTNRVSHTNRPCPLYAGPVDGEADHHNHHNHHQTESHPLDLDAAYDDEALDRSVSYYDHEYDSATEDEDGVRQYGDEPYDPDDPLRREYGPDGGPGPWGEAGEGGEYGPMSRTTTGATHVSTKSNWSSRVRVVCVCVCVCVCVYACVC